MVELNEILKLYSNDIIFGSDISLSNWELDEYSVIYNSLKLLIIKHIEDSYIVKKKKDKYKIIENQHCRYYCPLCNKIVRHLQILHLNDKISNIIKNIINENKNLNIYNLFKMLLEYEKESLIIYACKDCN